MSEEKKSVLRQKLSTTRDELLILVQSLDQQQWEIIVYAEDQSWSVSDLLRHLTVSEKGMTSTIEAICQGGEGVPPDFDLDRWNARTIQKTQNKAPADLTVEMASNRAHLLEVLQSMKEDDWEKRGRHASLRIMSIEEILNLIADHERQHCQDIRLALAQIEN
jgi:uncharacterized damage-inducible protein DinB